MRANAAVSRLSLPIGDQRLEIGVHGMEVVVGCCQRGRVDARALLGEQFVQPGAAAGADPQRRAVDQ
jgi:hypothetical protein